LKILEENLYDHIIVWRTETALLFYRYLLKNYKKKFILNIRDYFHEENSFIYYLHRKLIKNSLLTTISSKGFLSFLPKHNYHMLHSYNPTIFENPENKISNKTIHDNKVIKIGFVGAIRFHEINKKLLRELGNDERFILQYFGAGSNS